ncbi:hypothetical protein BC830DRAFT_1178524 [Chytriomyces sp. MP71]|nr:hypothetical protein BC830DRAFT_1178524 [Chytriomyces sp. MP71]
MKFSHKLRIMKDVGKNSSANYKSEVLLSTVHAKLSPSPTATMNDSLSRCSKSQRKPLLCIFTSVSNSPECSATQLPKIKRSVSRIPVASPIRTTTQQLPLAACNNMRQTMLKRTPSLCPHKELSHLPKTLPDLLQASVETPKSSGNSDPSFSSDEEDWLIGQNTLKRLAKPRSVSPPVQVIQVELIPTAFVPPSSNLMDEIVSFFPSLREERCSTTSSVRTSLTLASRRASYDANFQDSQSHSTKLQERSSLESLSTLVEAHASFEPESDINTCDVDTKNDQTHQDNALEVLSALRVSGLEIQTELRGRLAILHCKAKSLADKRDELAAKFERHYGH